jgi:hypothetical protein
LQDREHCGEVRHQGSNEARRPLRWASPERSSRAGTFALGGTAAGRGRRQEPWINGAK